MKAFSKERGIVATLDRANVDTDQIIPKQFLKSIKRTGFEEGLFFDWARRSDGSPDPDFELNAPCFGDARILVARSNFGCGSSREHAVWAIVQAGYTVVIAPWRDQDGNRVPAFADIFATNCMKNGLLTLELSEYDVDRIFAAVGECEGLEASVDLEAQTITLHGPEEVVVGFDIDPVRKDYLLRGQDDIARTLEHAGTIAEFESRHDTQIAGS